MFPPVTLRETIEPLVSIVGLTVAPCPLPTITILSLLSIPVPALTISIVTLPLLILTLNSYPIPEVSPNTTVSLSVCSETQGPYNSPCGVLNT